MRNFLILTVCFSFLGVSAQFATAGTWVDLVNNKTYVDGVEVEGIGIQDLVLDGLDPTKGESQFLQLLTGDFSGVVNPKVDYDFDDALLTIDELAIQAATFHTELALDNINGVVGLSLLKIKPIVDPCFHRSWTVDYQGGLPDDPLTINCNGTALLANTFAGTVVSGQGISAFVFGGGATDMDFAAADYISTGGFSGTASHLGYNGPATIRPDLSVSGSSIGLSTGGRFDVSVDYLDGLQSGVAIPVQVTDDSAAFYLGNTDVPDLLIKILDSCNQNEHFSVFVDGTTSDGFDITITDADTLQTRTYSKEFNEPFVPIADISAFSTCTPEIQTGEPNPQPLSTIDSDGNSTTAVVSGGITKNNGVTYNKNATVSEGNTISVNFTIKPEPEHIGLTAGIVVAVEDKITGVITVLNGADGLFYLLDELNPVLFQTIDLSNENSIEVANNVAITAAEVGLDVNIHVGYIVDGVIYYNNEAVSLTVE